MRLPRKMRSQNSIFTQDEFTKLVVQWSIKYAVDRWWRDKYSIAFNTSKHRAANFFDMLFELEEYVLYNQPQRFTYRSKYEEYLATGSWINHDYLTQSSLDSELVTSIYDNIDLSQFDDE